MKKEKDIAIVGAGGFGMEVAALISQINDYRPQWNLIGFFDDEKSLSSTINGRPVLGGLEDLNAWQQPLAVVLAIGTSKSRMNIKDKLNNRQLNYPNLIHPSVILGEKKYLEIGEGTIICAGTIMTTHIRIGSHVILNLACTVGHESQIDDFCSFMPSCNISGEVKIGKASFWGTGAKIINRKTVGKFTTIGAGAVVTKNIPDYATVVGVPAKQIKQDMP